MTDRMPNVFCVRGYSDEHGGPQAKHFVAGGYAAISFIHHPDFVKATDRETIYALYRKFRPEETSPNVVGQQVGQIARFLFEIQPGDYILTPDYNPDGIYWGVIQDGVA